MTEKKLWRRTAVLLATALMLGLTSPQTGAMSPLPDAMVLQAGSVASVDVWLPLSAEVARQSDAAPVSVERRGGAAMSLTAGEKSGTAEVVFRLMGLVPVKTMRVTVEQPKILIPGGQSLGVAVQTKGLVVVGSSDLGATPSPARRAGIRPGDIIRSVDAIPVNSASELL